MVETPRRPLDRAPRVSVVIPTRDRATLLSRAVASVLAQSYADFELIIVDDHSTDATAELTATLTDERIRWCRHDWPGGQSRALNTGIGEARGVYVAFLDDDDEWLPDKLAAQVALLDRAPGRVGLVYGWREIVDERSGTSREGPRLRLRGDIYESMLALRTPVPPSSWLLRTTVARAVRFDDGLRVAKDLDFVARFCLAGWEVDVVPEVVLRKHEHGAGQLTDPTADNLRERIDQVRAHMARFEDELAARPAARAALCWRIVDYAAALPDGPALRGAAAAALRLAPWRTCRWLLWRRRAEGRLPFFAGPPPVAHVRTGRPSERVRALLGEARRVAAYRSPTAFLGWLGRLPFRRALARRLAGNWRQCRAAALYGGRCVQASVARPGVALDPVRTNPIGWRAEHDGTVLALGPRDALPHGVATDGVAHPEDTVRLGQCRNIVDVAAFHASPEARAHTLIRLAGLGVPVHLVDRDPALERLLGGPLYAELAAGLDGLDDTARAFASVRARRLALRDHARTADGGAPTPPVSLVLATRRPALLERALGNVARQDYPRLELVLALHGDGFDFAEVRARLGELLTMPVTVVRQPAGRVLGEVLNAATAAADGQLVARMDDDDVYAGEHVWDLVLAHAYSRAELVGKRNEVVYLRRRDTTVVLDRGAEGPALHVTGSALAMRRDDFRRLGWRPIRRGVDEALARDVVRAGGSVYRTHGFGYVFVRHGAGHTWLAPDRHFLETAQSAHAGWRPDLAGMPDQPRP